MASRSRPTRQHSRNNRARFDDLTAIKGVGETMEQWFRESFGIRSFRDLAATPIDDMEALARKEGRNVSRKRLEDIVAQAQTLACSPSAPPERGEPMPTSSPNSTDVNGDWNEFASFTVYFEQRGLGDRAIRRTKVHHMERDETETWPGIESERLCKWMVRRLDGPTEEPAATSRAPAQSRPALDVPLPIPQQASVITRVSVNEVSRPQFRQCLFENGQLHHGFIASGELELTVAIRVSDRSQTEDETGGKTFHISMFAQEFLSSATDRAAMLRPEELTDGQLEYTATLPAVTLSPGLYSLSVTAVVRNRHAVADQLRIPVLQVT